MKEINRKKMISKIHKNVCKTLNYIEQVLILASKIKDAISFLLLLL